ncbi:hypothetical protein Scel_19280 [Streptomyces cellostaticus]|nr:hypothetical protein Scel_19280 [Streptomyces cellostaticus]
MDGTGDGVAGTGCGVPGCVGDGTGVGVPVCGVDGTGVGVPVCGVDGTGFGVAVWTGDGTGDGVAVLSDRDTGWALLWTAWAVTVPPTARAAPTAETPRAARSLRMRRDRGTRCADMGSFGRSVRASVEVEASTPTDVRPRARLQATAGQFSARVADRRCFSPAS